MKKFMPYLKKFIIKYLDLFFWFFLVFIFVLYAPEVFPGGYPDIGDPLTDPEFYYGAYCSLVLFTSFNFVYSIFCFFKRNSPPSGEDK